MCLQTNTQNFPKLLDHQILLKQTSFELTPPVKKEKRRKIPDNVLFCWLILVKMKKRIFQKERKILLKQQKEEEKRGKVIMVL